MCGIAGILSRTPVKQADIYAMNLALKHRGPDAQNIYISNSGKVAFGHNRLSVIDLSQQANQPMHSGDGRFVIVFNGEIYNFKAIRRELEGVSPAIHFITNSDTEVILHAFATWGVDMVQKFDGMFSIAIYDKHEDKVFLFRDRIGKKPLFYFCNHEHFIFASEIKALLQHPSVSSFKEVDHQAIHEFLHLGYIPEPKTIYRSIRKFPSGSVGQVWSNLSFSIQPYWRVSEQIGPSKNTSSEDSLKTEFQSKLIKAVEKRLISDVPLGVFLSGGTDSSLITAIASKLTGSPIKTFNIGFKENKFNERDFASQVAKHLKTNHHEYVLSENEAVGLLETYLNHLDEPFADTSTIPTMLVSRLARKEVTVALTGDGGDELFLGYGAYTWSKRLANPFINIARPLLAKGLQTFGDSKYKRVAHLFEGVKRPYVRSHIFSQEQYFFSNTEIETALLRDPLAYEPFRYSDPDSAKSKSEEEKQALFDLNFYLKDDLLVKTDRASMYFGLECRCPLLDAEIINFALHAPFQIKRKNGVDKWILKECLKTYLPTELVNRPKWGFSIPLAQWMKNELGYLMEYLSEENLDKTALFKTTYVKDLVSRFYKGEEYLYNRLWAVIVMQRFLINLE